jgi:hypothetical protein
VKNRLQVCREDREVVRGTWRSSPAGGAELPWTSAGEKNPVTVTANLRLTKIAKLDPTSSHGGWQRS